MTNLEKVKRFIMSEVFLLEDLNYADRPMSDIAAFKRWLRIHLGNYNLELCNQKDRYYVGLGTATKNWHDLAVDIMEREDELEYTDFLSGIIAYMDLVLENETPKVEVSYSLESLEVGDLVIYQTGDCLSFDECKEGMDWCRNYRSFVILKNAKQLLRVMP
jgi:hypothetical protein